MHNLYKNSGTPQDKVIEIQNAQQELKQHGHEMSPYERNLISREIKKRQDDLLPALGGLVIGELYKAIEKFKASETAMQIERTKEINRFDSQKLNAEMQLIKTRVDLALKQDTNALRGDRGTSEKLQQIYTEAIQSGDLHKQRAAVEVLKSISVNGPERINVNELARTAETAENELRQTEGTRQAQQARIDALGELHNKHEELNKVSTLLGMGDVNGVFNAGPFAQAARMVEFTPEGPRIYNADAPEVTGVDWHRLATSTT